MPLAGSRRGESEPLQVTLREYAQTFARIDVGQLRSYLCPYTNDLEYQTIYIIASDKLSKLERQNSPPTVRLSDKFQQRMTYPEAFAECPIHVFPEYDSIEFIGFDGIKEFVKFKYSKRARKDFMLVC